MFSTLLRKAPEGFLTQVDIKRISKGRRDLFAGAFKTALSGMTLASLPSLAKDDPNIMELPAHSKGLGQGVATNPYGAPSQYEKNVQRRESPGLTQVTQAGVSFCPLQSLFGIITPSGLHFERHHQGWWDIDPSKHRLMINGSDEKMLRRPMVFTMDELLRMPSITRTHFIECGANSGMEWGNVAVPTVQYTHGMLSCSEFTGVPLRALLELCGVDFRRAKFVLAEGADGSSMTRTIPLSLIQNDEVLVAYGQNGEMLRPENGYPLRLVVPGVQGVSWVKYLRRIEVGDMPYATKDEVIGYADLMKDGLHRQYTSIQEVKSVITSPSGGQVLLQKGFCNISGVAWSGRGAIKRVEVSVDGGRNWRVARLQTPVMSKCLTRFQIDWSWSGDASLLMSRAVDEIGHVQPTYAQNRAVRGSRGIYHNNSIQTWLIEQSGEVKNVQLS